MKSRPLNGAAGGAGLSRPLAFASIFNFSANHLALISRTEYRSCVVFVIRGVRALSSFSPAFNTETY